MVVKEGLVARARTVLMAEGEEMEGSFCFLVTYSAIKVPFLLPRPEDLEVPAAPEASAVTEVLAVKAEADTAPARGGTRDLKVFPGGKVTQVLPVRMVGQD